MNKPILLNAHLQESIRQWFILHVGNMKPFKQKNVAAACGVSSSQISDLKSGKFVAVGYDGWMELIKFAKLNGWEGNKQ